jgi:general secretion pathway protein G
MEPESDPSDDRQGGFTLLELIIVIAIIGILATVAMPMMKNLPTKAKESTLKQTLHTMRDMLDQHYADKGFYPPSLQTLVEEGYLRNLPIDPFTGSSDTWIEIVEEIPEDLAAETEYSEDGPGIWDVASGSDLMSLDGTSYYSEW